MTTDFNNLIRIPTSPYYAFRHYFIPHEGNDHRPHAVRPKALKIYSALLIGLKLFITIFLYSSYPTVAYFSELTAETVFRLTNSARSTSGEKTLTLNSQLSVAAKAKAEDMLRAGYFDHTGPDGKKFWQWIREAGYSYTTAGENLAMDFSSAESAQNALLDSPSHRANILRSTYRDIGLGIAQGMMNGRNTTVLVELFATPQPAEPVVARATATVPSTLPTYRASLVGTSDERFMLLPGSELALWADFRNDGTTVWENAGEHVVTLNLSDPQGRESVFRHAAWTRQDRPAVLDNRTVAPGEIGRFSFLLRAPQSVGDYTESFELTAENIGWIEGGALTLPFTVLLPQQATDVTPQELVRQAFTTTSVETASPEKPETLKPSEPSQPATIAAIPKTPDWKTALVLWTTKIFWALIVFLAASLALTVLIRIRIQHSTVIAQTVLVLLLALGVTFLKTHFAENPRKPIVIGSVASAKSFTLLPQSDEVSIKRDTDFQFRVAPSQSVAWEVRGDIGSISPEGIFTAKKLGKGRILASSESETRDVEIRVVSDGTLIGAARTDATCTTLRSWLWSLLLLIYLLAGIIGAAASERSLWRWLWFAALTAGVLMLFFGTRCPGIHTWVPLTIVLCALIVGVFIVRVLRRQPYEPPFPR